MPRIVREKFPLSFFPLLEKSTTDYEDYVILKNQAKRRNHDGCIFPINVLSTRSSSLPCLDRSIRYANARTINGGRPTFLRDVCEIMLVADFPLDNRRILCRLNPWNKKIYTQKHIVDRLWSEIYFKLDSEEKIVIDCNNVRISVISIIAKNWILEYWNNRLEGSSLYYPSVHAI